MNRSLALLAGLLTLGLVGANSAEDRRERVLRDRVEVEAGGDWVYNDLPRALTEAGRAGKPVLAVIRCVP